MGSSLARFLTRLWCSPTRGLRSRWSTPGSLQSVQSSDDKIPHHVRSPSRRLPALTHGLAGLGEGLQLEALLTLALVAALEVHAELAAGVGVLTLVDICGMGHREIWGIFPTGRRWSHGL